MPVGPTGGWGLGVRGTVKMNNVGEDGEKNDTNIVEVGPQVLGPGTLFPNPWCGIKPVMHSVVEHTFARTGCRSNQMKPQTFNFPYDCEEFWRAVEKDPSPESGRKEEEALYLQKADGKSKGNVGRDKKVRNWHNTSVGPVSRHSATHEHATRLLTPRVLHVWQNS